MHRLFGKAKPQEPKPTLGDAATSINNRVGALDEKIKGLDAELIKFKDQLKKAKGPAAANIKRRALETLKRKKMYETQRDQMAGQAFNVEQTSFAIESVRDTQTTIFAMKEASKQLKVEHKKININDIDNMHDDLEDMFDDMNEINDMMARSYGTPEGLDEEDLEAELEALGDELEIGEGEDVDLGTATAAPSATATQPTPQAQPAQPQQQQQQPLPAQPTGRPTPLPNAPATPVTAQTVPNSNSNSISFV